MHWLDRVRKISIRLGVSASVTMEREPGVESVLASPLLASRSSRR